MASDIHEPGYPRNQPDDVDDVGGIRRLPEGSVLREISNRMALLEQQKKDISAQQRELSKEFQEKGGTKLALGFIRRIEKMDPDDREEFLWEIDAYLTYLKHW